jgi:hypothetical protein
VELAAKPAPPARRKVAGDDRGIGEWGEGRESGGRRPVGHGRTGRAQERRRLREGEERRRG